VNTPTFNAFSPGLKRCGAALPPIPPGGPGSFKVLQALSRAAGQVGKTFQPNGTQWACWCDRFVAFAYGLSQSGFTSAWNHYNSVLARGMIHTDRNPPAGALVFYNVSRPSGHVVFSVGDGVVITTPYSLNCPAVGVVYKTTLGAFNNYLGWSWPDWQV
jgi:hypothetical protein